MRPLGLKREIEFTQGAALSHTQKIARYQKPQAKSHKPKPQAKTTSQNHKPKPQAKTTSQNHKPKPQAKTTSQNDDLPCHPSIH
jgi:hypothetical protein